MSTLPFLCAIWHAVLWILMDLKNQWVDVTELMLPWRYYVPVLIAMATGSQWVYSNVCVCVHQHACIMYVIALCTW